MATIYSPNIAAVASDWFAHEWQQVRAMLKSGWLLKHSSDGTNKSSANSADPMQCKWVAPAIVQDFSATGTASITTKDGKDFNITGLSGLVTPSKTNRGGSEGNMLVITNATSGNNTTWLITKVVSSTACLARPLVPGTTTTAGTPGTTITVFGHLCRSNATAAIRVQPASTGALGTATIKFSMDDGSTYSSAVTISASGIVEIIDVNGVATGIYVVIAGSIANAGSGVDYWRLPVAAATDANNGSIRWVERSWLTSTYSASAPASNGWMLLEGPCTLKIPFTTPPSGVFLRGENIKQATSNAEGEVLGVTYEPSTGVGFMVVMPRHFGSGTGAEGWGTGLITGDSSLATVAPSALPTRLVREMVIWKGTSAQAQGGTMYYQPVVDSTENSSRFGFLSLQSGCTATVAPGGGGINNGFPAIAYSMGGTGGSAGHKSDIWIGTNYASTNAIGRLQSFVANTIDIKNTSADGSFIGFVGQPTTTATACGPLPIFMRLDNQEDGEMEPYASMTPGGINLTSRSRTTLTDTVWGGIGGADANGTIIGITNANGGWNIGGLWATWRRRTYSTGDAFLFAPNFYMVNGAQGLVGSYINVWANNTTTDQDRVGSTAMTTSPLILEPVTLSSTSVGARGRKGTLRWIYAGYGVNAYDTWNGKSLIQMGTSTNNTILGLTPFLPYDGSTTPLQ